MLLEKFGSVVKIFKNKYFSSIVLFVLWIAFFDRNDLLTQLDRKNELKKLETSKAFYEQEIAVTRKDLMDLNNDPGILEKFAREKFYLKKPGEEIFVIVDSSKEKKGF